MKQNLNAGKKRKRTAKQLWEPKSKDKQIMFDKPKKSFGKGKRTRVCDIYNNAEDQYMCLERAGMLLEHLDAELPKFAKCMLPSNVLYSFWLILPKKFCVMHLPEYDTTITLVDESGKEFKTNYLKLRHGLSGGWRGFSIAQRLLQGDILFFHLVESCKLKVHIVRRYGLEAVEAAICLMEMHPRIKKTKASISANNKTLLNAPFSESSKHEIKKGKRTKRSPKKCMERLLPNGGPTWADNEGDSDVASNLDSNPLDDRCDNNSDAFSLEILEGSSTKTSEHGYGVLNLCHHEGVDCESTVRRIYSSTVAT